MDENLLAFYMGYAFNHAINIQHTLESKALMVPFVVYWQNGQPSPVPYPAATQEEAVKRARMARVQKELDVTGWSSCREGTLQQNDGTALDVLLVEGWVPGLAPPLEMFVYCRKEPFRLIRGFLWKNHPNTRNEANTRMAEFKRGMRSHSFGQQGLEYVEYAEQVQYTNQ